MGTVSSRGRSSGTRDHVPACRGRGVHADVGRPHGARRVARATRRATTVPAETRASTKAEEATGAEQLTHLDDLTHLDEPTDPAAPDSLRRAGGGGIETGGPQSAASRLTLGRSRSASAPDRLTRLVLRIPAGIRAWLPLVARRGRHRRRRRAAVRRPTATSGSTRRSPWRSPGAPIPRPVRGAAPRRRPAAVLPAAALLDRALRRRRRRRPGAVRRAQRRDARRVAWFAGRRVARVAAAFGHVERSSTHRAGTAALLLFATSPYAIRYGSETRMYSLVVLLVLLFGLALARALEKPSWRTLGPADPGDGGPRLHALLDVPAARDRGGLPAAAVAAPGAVPRPVPQGAAEHGRRAAVLFLPWLPTFVFQMLHTGTPWAPKVQAQVLLDTIFDWAGHASTGALLGLVLLFAAFVGLTARPAGDGLHVDLKGRVPGRYLAAVWLGAAGARLLRGARSAAAPTSSATPASRCRRSCCWPRSGSACCRTGGSSPRCSSSSA